MSDTTYDFKHSIYIARKLRSGCESYEAKYKKIISAIHPNPIRYKFIPTGLWSEAELKIPLEPDEYRLFKLNVRCRLEYKDRVKHNYIMLGFDTKHQLHAFLQDFHIHKNQVALCFWNYEPKRDEHNEIVSAGNYKLVLKIPGLFKTTISKFQKELKDYCNRYTQYVYNNIKLYDYVQLASSIHDRWFDPFKMEKIYNFDQVYNSFMDAKPYNFVKISRTIQHKIDNYISRRSHSSNNFISNISIAAYNKEKLNDALNFSTSFYYRYLEKHNPYKLAAFRKDWKFAAEQFVLEVIGKHLYYQNKIATEDLYSCKRQDYENLTYTDRPGSIAKLYNQFKSKEELDRHIKGLYEEKEELKKELDKVVEEDKSYRKEIEKKYRYGEIEFFGEFMEDENDRKLTQEALDYQKVYEEKKKEYESKIKKLENEVSSNRSQIKFYTDNYWEKHRKYHKEVEDLKYEIYGLVFSKREMDLFIESLKLKTKINGCKLRKIVLDVLTELNMLETRGDYSWKKSLCRKYLFNIDITSSMINMMKHLKKVSTVLFEILSNGIKLENLVCRISAKVSDFPSSDKISFMYYRPPD